MILSIYFVVLRYISLMTETFVEIGSVIAATVVAEIVLYVL